MQVLYEIIETNEKGKGVYSQQIIKEGEIIWKLDYSNVKIYESKEDLESFLQSLENQQAKDYIQHMYTFNQQAIYCLDIGIYFNHSSNANVRLQEDGNTRASRDIEKGEELCENYLDYKFISWFKEISENYQVQDCLSFAQSFNQQQEKPKCQLQEDQLL